MTKLNGLSERQALWLEDLRACVAGSLKDCAAAHGLNLRALYDAKARFKRKGLLKRAPPRLLRVERAESRGSSAALCRVHLRNGTTVEVARKVPDTHKSGRRPNRCMS